MPPQNADANVSTRKPGTTAAASSSIKPLITNQKMPRVRIVSGSVINFNKAPRVAFTNPITRADQSRNCAFDVKSGHELRHHPDRQGTKNPVDKNAHVVLRSLRL